MGWLMPVGAGSIVMGLTASAAACYQNAETPASMILAPLAGLSLAAGIILVGIGIGHWRRPVLSDTRPANPWSDQPGEHGDPPRGLV